MSDYKKGDQVIIASPDGSHFNGQTVKVWKDQAPGEVAVSVAVPFVGILSFGVWELRRA